MKVISLDCETNGLGGQAFAAAAVLTGDDGREVDVWEVGCPIVGDVDPWVAANVLPVLGVMTEQYDDYPAMCAGWREWWGYVREQQGPDVELHVVAHVVWPVEAKFLRDAHVDNLFDGPYPLIDVAPLLLAAGHDPTSVDSYLDVHGLPKPAGSPHHPLYDARAAEAAFRHLMAAAQRARTAYRVAPIEGGKIAAELAQPIIVEATP